MRVVSLVPSVTETLLAWGVTPIACTRFCEQPEIPAVGGTKNPDLTRIVDLAPDLVVMDVEENRLPDHEALEGAGISVHVLAVRSLADVGPQLEGLAQVLGVRSEPIELPPARGRRAAAFVPIWRRPYMALGEPTYGASVLAHLGIAVSFGERGPYPEVTLEEAAAARPDAVLAPSEPFHFTKRQLPELEPVAPVTFVDGKDLFWWGARTPAALQRLDRALGSLSPRD